MGTKTVTVRLPEDLYDRLAQAAKDNFRSLNQEMTYRISLALAQEESADKDK